MMASYIVRPGRKEDCSTIYGLLEELCRIQNASERFTLSVEDFEKCLFGEKQTLYSFVAELQPPSDGNTSTDDSIVGCVLYSEYCDYMIGNSIFIQGIMVKSEQQGKGMGTALVQAVLKASREAGCTGAMTIVQGSNKASLELFQRFGAKNWTLDPMDNSNVLQMLNNKFM